MPERRVQRVNKLWLEVGTIIAAGLFLFLPYAQSAEDKLVTGIKSLIGMRIPPVVPGKNPGTIPGWHDINSSILIGLDPSEFGMEEGFIGEETGFIVDKFESDKTRIILDGRALPKELMAYQVVNGKAVWLNDSYRKHRITRCEIDTTEENVIGLMRPEPGKEDCMHKSRQVKKAWRVDQQTGKLEEISPSGVRCYWVGEYNCE